MTEATTLTGSLPEALSHSLACRLRPNTLSRVGGWPDEGWDGTARSASARCRTGGGTPDDSSNGAVREIAYRIGSGTEGVEGRIPARIRERVIQRAFVRNTEAAAQRRLAIAKHIVGKTDAWAEILILVGAESIGFRETT